MSLLINGAKLSTINNDKVNSVVEEFEKRKKEIEATIHNVQNEYLANQKWYRFWQSKEDKELERKLNWLSEQYDKVCKRIEEVKSERFYTARELERKAHSFLIDNGFNVQSHTTNGTECVDEIEVWVREQ